MVVCRKAGPMRPSQALNASAAGRFDIQLRLPSIVPGGMVRSVMRLVPGPDMGISRLRC